ncbi:NiFe hydrogenase [Shewanella sp. JM162201]|uniref:NiFe hydrogenase n=1 Tax=Shewanella jiangmenensis TaxID=2837387 RepID=A0ABS5VAF6_9GAMM|nr:NiFe hydrogenase [Shewanella jiangmenensis]MBT1446008.1 NiFe hydrogenase [Shewanella jiangmenensis]
MSAITTTPADTVPDVKPLDTHQGVKPVRFEFDTSRQVPFYQATLQSLITDSQYQALALDAGASKLERGYRYWLHAHGEQTELGAFADSLAQAFPLSCFLLGARVCAADDEANKPLPPQIDSAHTIDTPKLAFCGHCYPRFGDNQSPEFGKLDLVCPHCHGEQFNHSGEQTQARHAKAPTLDELKVLAKAVIGGDTTTLDATTLESRRYSLKGSAQRDTLLVCNPNSLPGHLLASEADVLALSSIEKPRLRLMPIPEHGSLCAPSYRVRFAASRAELVLCELLRVKGIDYLFIQDTDSTPELCAIDGRWHCISEALTSAGATQYTVLAPGVTLAHNIASSNGVIAQAHGQSVSLRKDQHSASGSVKGPALLSLKGLTGKSGKALAHHASLYLGTAGPLEIATVDGQGKEEVFFSQTPLPDNGYDIYRLLMESPQRTVLEKFKASFPQECLAMLDISFSPTMERGNLQGLWAMGACILGLGLGREKPSVAFLSDVLISEAQKFRGQTAPRIDYPLIRGEALRSINWCKTLGTLMSFRLAGDEDKPKLAFAMMDSLADYLANWIEHLDLNVGIRSVYVSGSELANPVLAKRLWLRLGKNFPIETNPERDLDGAIFAIGALLTQTPRRFGALGREAQSADASQ